MGIGRDILDTGLLQRRRGNLACKEITKGLKGPTASIILADRALFKLTQHQKLRESLNNLYNGYNGYNG
eukprot:601453-Pelagomonas_calceolata.AAC.1